MNLRLAILALTTCVVCAASSASAFPGNVTSIPSALVENTEVTSGRATQAAKIGFGQAGPIGVMNATTHMGRTESRLGFYAGTKGFVVNRIGAVYDLEGGAILKMRHGVSLTGSYRMIGYDFLATGSENAEPQLSGGFFGLQLDF